MEIAGLVDGEEAAVIALWQACGLTRPWNDPLADIAAARASLASDVLVGRQNGAVIGSVMVGHDGHRGWIYYLGVHPEHRRRGFGRALTAAACDWLEARGAVKAQLMVRDDTIEAARFYEALGFARQPVVVLGRWLRGSNSGTS